MRINGHAIDAYSRVALTPQGSTPKVATSNQSAGSGEAAEVNVSDEAKALAATASNEKKVADLKASVDNGTYRVNTQILAARLLDTLG